VKRLAWRLFPEQHVERQDVFKEGKKEAAAKREHAGGETAWLPGLTAKASRRPKETYQT
jgi:hypothetical protein